MNDDIQFNMKAREVASGPQSRDSSLLCMLFVFLLIFKCIGRKGTTDLMLEETNRQLMEPCRIK